MIAGKIAEQANSLCVHVDLTQGLENAGGKGASPEKAEASQAVVAKPIVGTKRRAPSVLELFAAQG